MDAIFGALGFQREAHFKNKCVFQFLSLSCCKRVDTQRSSYIFCKLCLKFQGLLILVEGKRCFRKTCRLFPSSSSIIVHIILDNIPGNCINSIVIFCLAGIEFNFIFHSTVIILQFCFCEPDI